MVRMLRKVFQHGGFTNCLMFTHNRIHIEKSLSGVSDAIDYILRELLKYLNWQKTVPKKYPDNTPIPQEQVDKWYKEDTNKLTNQSGGDATITNVDPQSTSITIEQTLIDFGRKQNILFSMDFTHFFYYQAFLSCFLDI